MTVRRGAERLQVTTYPPQNGYAKPTIVFDVKGVKAKGIYTVQVRNIRGTDRTARTYRVRLFKP